MFRRILIGNRGEVAARVLRTCRRLGIEAIAAVSEADRGLQWLAEADGVAVLPGPPRQAYLDAGALIAAAREHRCAAIHPGWGFLSENARYAARCANARVTFIGPPPAAMRIMGNKLAARAQMRAFGVPVLPGSAGVVADAAEARKLADEVGYPVLLKARSGGGGRGMRKVFGPEEVADAFSQATAEALSSFGDGGLFLEKLVVGGRHIEFQVFGDAYGNVACLGERECSVQRRHQKLLEESPSPVVTPELRAAMGAMVADACRAVGYRLAGTVEMLRARDGKLYFLEMNTRLQVEHPVTELVTGLDLVELQLRGAANEVVIPRVQTSGHAIECRINAEDPDNDFRPAPGRVTRLRLPQGEGIRVDTHLREGDSISPHYDSMIAKILVHAPDRAGAITRMREALAQATVEGVPTTIGLHRRILEDARFVSGDYDTGLLGG